MLANSSQSRLNPNGCQGTRGLGYSPLPSQKRACEAHFKWEVAPLTVVGGFAVLVDVETFFFDAGVDADAHRLVKDFHRYPAQAEGSGDNGENRGCPPQSFFPGFFFRCFTSENFF